MPRGVRSQVLLQRMSDIRYLALLKIDMMSPAKGCDVVESNTRATRILLESFRIPGRNSFPETRPYRTFRQNVAVSQNIVRPSTYVSQNKDSVYTSCCARAIFRDLEKSALAATWLAREQARSLYHTHLPQRVAIIPHRGKVIGNGAWCGAQRWRVLSL